ncbi:hypothetical protein F2981_25720 (plasmid) [Sinorhizobium meliloti]|nr:hypothetical protein [Sinorhizobium meliloti]
MTARRWDTPEHAAENELRRDPDGKPYDPVHDIQWRSTGRASRAIGDLCRSRWKAMLRREGNRGRPPREGACMAGTGAVPVARGLPASQIAHGSRAPAKGAAARRRCG